MQKGVRSMGALDLIQYRNRCVNILTRWAPYPDNQPSEQRKSTPGKQPGITGKEHLSNPILENGATVTRQACVKLTVQTGMEERIVR